MPKQSPPFGELRFEIHLVFTSRALRDRPRGRFTVIDVFPINALVQVVAAIQLISSGAAIEPVIAIVSTNLIISARRAQNIISIPTAEFVIALATEERVVPIIAAQIIVIVAAVDPIVAVLAAHPVVPATRADRVIAVLAADPVPAVRADDHVVAVGAAKRAVIDLSVLRSADDPAVLAHEDRGGKTVTRSSRR